MRYLMPQEDEFIIRKYDYKVPWFIIVIMVFSGGLITFAGFHEGIYNTQGLIIRRRFSTLVELLPEQATIFYRLMALFGLALFLWSVALAVNRLRLRQSIVISTESLIVPKSLLSAKTVRIPFSAIRGLQVIRVNGQRSAKILVRAKKYTISAALLPKQEDFDEILLLLSEVVRSSQRVDRS